MLSPLSPTTSPLPSLPSVYPTGTKDTEVVGLQRLAQVCSAVAPLPVVAIGGLGVGNAADTIRAGCAGVAVVSAVFGVPDAVGAARTIRQVVDQAVAQVEKQGGDVCEQGANGLH